MSVVCSPFDFSVLSLEDFFGIYHTRQKNNNPQHKIFFSSQSPKTEFAEAAQTLLSNTNSGPRKSHFHYGLRPPSTSCKDILESSWRNEKN